MSAVMGIFARENSQGLFFQADSEPVATGAVATPEPPEPEPAVDLAQLLVGGCQQLG